MRKFAVLISVGLNTVLQVCSLQYYQVPVLHVFCSAMEALLLNELMVQYGSYREAVEVLPVSWFSLGVAKGLLSPSRSMRQRYGALCPPPKFLDSPQIWAEFVEIKA